MTPAPPTRPWNTLSSLMKRSGTYLGRGTGYQVMQHAKKRYVEAIKSAMSIEELIVAEIVGPIDLHL